MLVRLEQLRGVQGSARDERLWFVYEGGDTFEAAGGRAESNLRPDEPSPWPASLRRPIQSTVSAAAGARQLEPPGHDDAVPRHLLLGDAQPVVRDVPVGRRPQEHAVRVDDLDRAVVEEPHHRPALELGREPLDRRSGTGTDTNGTQWSGTGVISR